MIKVGIEDGAGYANGPFADIMSAGSQPKRVLHPIRIAALSVTDNLVKGTAGQAIHNMNIVFGLPEIAALNIVPLLP